MKHILLTPLKETRRIETVFFSTTTTTMFKSYISNDDNIYKY